MTDEVRKQVVVWVCPHPECGSYYGSGVAGDLSASPNLRTHMQNAADEPSENWGQIISYRDHCPDCRQSGRKTPDGDPIRRVATSAVLAVPSLTQDVKV